MLYEYGSILSSFKHQRFSDQPWHKVSEVLSAVYQFSLQQETIVTPTPSVTDKIFESDLAVVRFAEPFFEKIGIHVRLMTEHVKAVWIRFALGDGNPEKVFAILLGYTVVGLGLAFYLNVLTVGTVKSAGRAVRSAVRQQLLVIKVWSRLHTI